TAHVCGSQCQFWASELGSRRSQPTLNHTGELNATFCCTSIATSSSWKIAASCALAKYPPARPQSRIVSATRPTNCRTPVSRSGVPSCPCRYFEATMFVAVVDQSTGTSTSFCSKIDLPEASVIEAVRRSHCTSSDGVRPAFEKGRVKVNR